MPAYYAKSIQNYESGAFLVFNHRIGVFFAQCIQ